MVIDLNQDIRITYLKSELLEKQNIRLGILRLDQIHPLISGNKWFKLKENIRAAKKEKKTTLLTFGGAFSNHLIATAAAAQQVGLNSIGIVRGFHARDTPTPTLIGCMRLGMQLHYISRSDYQLKHTPEYLNELYSSFPEAFIIPEGGNNRLGRGGVAEIVGYLPDNFDALALPVGSGTTFVGLRNAISNRIRMLGFAGFKNGAYLQPEIQEQVKIEQTNWALITSYHFGGFAKQTPDLIGFMNEFYSQFLIPLDFVYTGKMMFGLFNMIKQGLIPDQAHLIAVHTGGLQGNKSIAHLLDF